MNLHIPENKRQTVIPLWLEGNSRKHIAVTCGVSEGTVSNIVAEWKQKLDNGDAEALRELGINMKRTGIDAVQCAQGFRSSMIMRKMGVNEEDFESFNLNVYERCQRAGLTSDKIGSYLEDLFEFSKDDDANNNDGNIIKLSDIPYYIEQMKNEKRILKQDIQNLRKEKKQFQEEALCAKKLRDVAIEDEKTTVSELREYAKFKTELRRYGLSVKEDIPKFVQLVHGIKRYEYDVDRILSDYSDEQIKQIKRDRLNDQLRRLEDTRMGLESECSFLKSQVDLHRQMLYVYNELKSMELGLRELKILNNTIKEIAAENNIIDYRAAVDKFFEFLEQRYDVKIRLRIQEEQKQLRKYNNNNKPDKLISTYPFYPDIKSSTTALPKPSALEKQQQQHQQQMPSPSSISYTYRKITTIDSKSTKEEQNNQLNDNYQDEWYESDDDDNSL